MKWGKDESTGIPVLNYHGLTNGRDDKNESRRFWVSDAIFAKHLALIKEKGLGALSLVEARYADRYANERAVVITFDDGRESDYTVAFPALLAANSKAEFFLNTAEIGTQGFLQWSQVREMHEAGMSIQSHGHDHVDHSRLREDELRRQLVASKQEIEDRVGAPVRFFAAPYGEWNRKMLDIAREVGYEAVCTTEGQLAKCDSPIIDRIGIDGTTSSHEFDAILRRDSGFFASQAMQFRLKRVPKTLVMQLFPGVMKAWRDRHHE